MKHIPFLGISIHELKQKGCAKLNQSL